MKQLSPADGAEFKELVAALERPETTDKDRLLARLGALGAKGSGADSIDEFEEEDLIDVRGDHFDQLMNRANQLRSSGRLAQLGTQIRCPVVAIHGDSEPHSAAGVREPLRRTVADFRFILLKDCGHKPWVERNAREEFLQILADEL